MVFATFGHMAHFVGDQATNGFKGIVGVGAFKLDVKGVFNPLNGGVAADAVGAVSQAKNITFVASC